MSIASDAKLRGLELMIRTLQKQVEELESAVKRLQQTKKPRSQMEYVSTHDQI